MPVDQYVIIPGEPVGFDEPARRRRARLRRRASDDRIAEGRHGVVVGQLHPDDPLECRQVGLLDGVVLARREPRRHAHLPQLDERVHAEPHLDKLAGLEADDVHHAVVEPSARWRRGLVRAAGEVPVRGQEHGHVVTLGDEDRDGVPRIRREPLEAGPGRHHALRAGLDRATDGMVEDEAVADDLSYDVPVVMVEGSDEARGGDLVGGLDVGWQLGRSRDRSGSPFHG